MDLSLPDNLMLFPALKFCEELEKVDYSLVDKLVYKAKNFGTVEPFGMLLVGAKLREIKRKYIDIKHQYYLLDNPHSYAGHMGFFRSIGMKYGKEPGEAPGSKTYVPVSRIYVGKLQREAIEQRKPVGEIIETYSHELSKILYTGDEKTTEHMTFAIREIMRNVVEHSHSSTIWYSGQAWQSKDLVEIAILDEGVGIQESLGTNSYYQHIQDSCEVLKFALEPGITKTFSPARRKNYEEWGNTGFGLYMTSNICRNIGSFVICSGGYAIRFAGEEERIISTSFKGTAIRMRLKLSELSKVTRLRSELVREGEAVANRNKKMAISNASAASKLNFINKDNL